ncbi:MAG: cobaltochelatase subunit CobN, partial [Pseudomonadota bacterium]
MHVVFRESHGLEETETPTDLGQSPADLVVLSFSDSDLSAFSAGWHRAKDRGHPLPDLRLANLAALKHPVSVDTYIEQTLSGAKAVLVRLIGGVPYWDYGLQQLRALADEGQLVLAVVPGDGRPDPQLEALSTVPVATLDRLSHLVAEGGAVAAEAALAQLALAAGLYAGPVTGEKTVPAFGCWTPARGARAAATCNVCHGDCPAKLQKPLVLVTFYRAYVAAADTGAIEALFAALEARGFAVLGLFAPSLKATEASAWLHAHIAALGPVAIVNATAFSGKGADGTSPLDVAGVPVFQVALSTSDKASWDRSDRGLSPADLAMHVVLPEVDGRIFAGIASFKEQGVFDPDLQIALAAHQPVAERVAAIADRVAAWVGLARKAREKRIALVLSTYPGKPWQMAHAVGLDAIASAEAILSDLAEAGYTVSDGVPLEHALAHQSLEWPLSEYKEQLKALPSRLRADLEQVWGLPDDDPECRDGAFRFAVQRRGNALIALQPERANPDTRVDSYHDLSRTPRHGYVAFYLWLRSQVDALVHIGAHGTLEWLPGKSVALSDTCWPDVLIGDLPVIYPFIVNDPGEAAQAKRRIGAITLGHMPPPLAATGNATRFGPLEALLDEFSNADGLDPARRDRLQTDIRFEAQALGLEHDLGFSGTTCATEAITKIDQFVCDVKASQFGDGLHVWGQSSGEFGAGQSERDGLLSALAGRHVAPGPSGSPHRGRHDVLPTGRNLYTTDPRSVPTRAAYSQGVRLGEELVRRHLQDEGEYPKALIVDLWGSATMRTAGEEFAMALHLLGVRPRWDAGSERVSGFEILPITELSRPRIDVTLRISGLFRDVFPGLSVLFGQAVHALAARDEAADWNPYVQANGARVFGPKPGSFGLGMGDAVERLTPEARRIAGEAWLQASSWSYDTGDGVSAPEVIAARVRQADAFVHLQDLPETDLLLAADYAAHEAGFAAAKARTGGVKANLYHLDNADPTAPRARSLTEEIARACTTRA